MKLMIKQKVFSWGDKFDIYDEAQNPIYSVKGEVFSFGKKLHIYDMAGNELAGIFQKLFSFMPTYEIVIDGLVCGTIKKQFTFFKPAYDIDCNGWHVDGDFFDHNYTVYSGNMPVAQITKQWFSWGDTYVLDIFNPADHFVALLVVLAIDAAMESGSNSSNN